MDSHCPELSNQLGMVNIVKESFNIELNNIMQMHSLHKLIGSMDYVFHRAVRSETIAVLAEFCFTDWLHDLLDTLLYKPVPYTRDAEWAHFSIRLWDFLTSYGFWSITMFAACDDRSYRRPSLFVPGLLCWSERLLTKLRRSFFMGIGELLLLALGVSMDALRCPFARDWL